MDNIICTKNLHHIVCLQRLEVFVAFLYSLSIFTNLYYFMCVFSIKITIYVTDQDRVGRRDVVDVSLALYPGVLTSIPRSPSMSDVTLNRGPVF